MSHLETTLGQLEAEKVDMKSALKTAGYFLKLHFRGEFFREIDVQLYVIKTLVFELCIQQQI